MLVLQEVPALPLSCDVAALHSSSFPGPTKHITGAVSPVHLRGERWQGAQLSSILPFPFPELHHQRPGAG